MTENEDARLQGGVQQPQPLYHDPREDETVEEYVVVMEVVKSQPERSVTIGESFDVAAVSEAMAGEEAKHLAKEKYGTFNKVVEVIKA